MNLNPTEQIWLLIQYCIVYLNFMYIVLIVSDLLFWKNTDKFWCTYENIDIII